MEFLTAFDSVRFHFEGPGRSLRAEAKAFRTADIIIKGLMNTTISAKKCQNRTKSVMK